MQEESESRLQERFEAPTGQLDTPHAAGDAFFALPPPAFSSTDPCRFMLL